MSITDNKIISLNSASATLNNGTMKSNVYFNFTGLLTDEKVVRQTYVSIVNAQIPVSYYVINSTNNLLNFINHNHLSNIVKIIKFQSNPYKYLKKSDVFILTSKFEGLPNVLLEAQLLNKFVISSDCPTGPKEILLNGKLGFLFKRGNFLDLLNKFRIFKKNKNIIKRKIILARKKLNRFDYNSNISLYKKVVFELFSFIK